MTRAEFAKLLLDALQHLPVVGQDMSFTDAADHWATRSGHLQKMVELGLYLGYPEDGTLRPDDPISRAEVLKTVAASMGFVPGMAQCYGLPYHDVLDGDWFAPCVAWALRQGIIGANAPNPLWVSNSLEPAAPATRADVAIILTNLPLVRARGVQ
jgi:hypothetical protein